VKAGKKGDVGRKKRGGSSVKRLLLTPLGIVNDLELTGKEVYMVGNVNGMLVIEWRPNTCSTSSRAVFMTIPLHHISFLVPRPR
jgi:hypothetical protein